MNMQAQLLAAMEAAEARAEQTTHDSSPADPVVTLPVGSLQGHDVDEKPQRPLIKVKELSEKAMLVSCKTSVFSPYKRDEEATANYGAGNVSKHLFAGKGCLVKEVNALFLAVSTYIRQNTVPWTHKGVHMLNAMNYSNVTAGVRERLDKANAKLDVLVPNWPTVVQADYHRVNAIGLAKGNPNLANWDDYPQDIRSKYRFEIDFSPVPKPDDFDPRFGLSEEDKASLQRQLDDADRGAATHVIKELLDPMREWAEHLAKPVQDVKRFHKSLVDNMIDAADRMNRANVSDDPEIQRQINSLGQLASSINKNAVSHDQYARNTAKSSVEALMGQMQGLV
jgi:hypothetical protein